MKDQRVSIVAGARTPFVKAGHAFATLGPLALAKHAVRGQGWAPIDLLVSCNDSPPLGVAAGDYLAYPHFLSPSRPAFSWSRSG
ncbi:MAG TPA: hypothetical protein VFB89_05365 [Gemmatimonadales bacterium]|nr:hypothetical protein [Gemmatimonadales bacterium]